jgi:hypothetical protein
LAGLYSDIWLSWNGQPPLALLYTYPHGPTPKSIAFLFIFLSFVAFCIVDLYAIVAAVVRKRQIHRWRWVTTPLFIAGVAIAAIPHDVAFATAVRVWGPSKNARVDLQNAIARGHVDTVDAFLRHGTPQMIGPDARTVLHVAAEHGKLKIIDVALAHGADINAQDSRGRTPLHRAVQAREVETVRHLIARGADKKVADVSGATPEVLAQKAGREDVIRALVQR